MKKRIFVLSILLIASILCGCTSRAALLSNEYKSETEAIEEMETLLVRALETEDRELLKSAFSEKALSLAGDIDTGIDYIFDLFEGDIINVDGRNHSSEGHIEAAGRTTQISAWCYIKTTEATYKLSYLFWSVQELAPSEIGVYRLRLEPEDDLQMDNYDLYRIAGIDHPDREIIHKTADSILECIENRDIENFRKLFSTKALLNAQDFEAGAQYTFELYDGATMIGNYDSWVSREESDGEDLWKAYIAIKTTRDDYMLYFEYGLDENGDGFGGINRLKLTEIETPDSYDGYDLGDAYRNYGVYHSGWEQ